MPKAFVVSIHIPKTAGTTLATIFDRVFDRRVMYDYDGYEREQVATPSVQRNTGFIQDYFEVLHGHFLARKYLEVFPGAKFVATVRHPVDRIISQFNHERGESSSNSWYHDAIVRGDMDVVEFAQQNGIRNAMALHLQGRDLADYDLLLMSEDMLRSCALFNHAVRPIDLEARFGRPVDLPFENQRIERNNGAGFSDAERAAVYGKAAEDVELYVRAKELFQQKAARYLTF